METGGTQGQEFRQRAGEARAPLVFSTDHLPPEQQFEAWHARCGRTVALAADEGPSAPFAAVNEVWDLGRMALSRVNAPGVRFERDSAMIRRDGIDHWAIGVALRGTVTTRTASEDCVVAGPGQPFIWSMGEAYDGARGAVDWAVLFVPRDVVPEVGDALDARTGMVLDSPLGGLFADYLCALLRRLPEIGEEDRPAIARATRAMLSACVLTTGARAAVARSAFDGAAYTRAIRAIRANLGSATLGPATLSRMVGMSRSALYRAFERHGGVAARIQRERLLAARAALVNPEDRRSVQAIGEACGFPDPSTFSRAFRRMFGCTPREARHEGSLVGASGRTPASPAPGSRGDLFSMLRTL